MSLDAIDHKLTTSTTDENGVTTWSNPCVKDTINSKGEVFSKFGKKKAKEAALYCTYPIDYKMYTIIIIAF